MSIPANLIAIDETTSVEVANEYLGLKWVLIAVSQRGSANSTGPSYVLGWNRGEAPVYPEKKPVSRPSPSRM